MKTKTRAFAILPLILIASGIALIATWAVKPSLLPGASHRAAVSADTTADLIKADSARGAAAAASVVKIAEANGTAPESPAKSFISQESTVALSHLPAPDPKALIEAERRKVAVLSGQVEEARHLYDLAADKADKLSRERDEAISAKQAADTALATAAAAEHAATMQRLGAFAVAAICAGLWLYARFYNITPATIGQVRADILAGVNPVAALDDRLAPWHKTAARRAAVVHVGAATLAAADKAVA